MLFFCTAILGCAFLAPNARKISADAVASESDIKIIADSVVDYQYYQAKGTPDGITIADMTDTIAGANLSVSDSAITFQTSSNSYAKAVYIDFKVGLTVPAWEEWEISFDVVFVLTSTCSSAFTQSAGAFYFLPDDSTDDPNDTLADSSSLILSKYSVPTPDPSKIQVKGYQGNPQPFNRTETFNSGTLTFTNDSDDALDITFSYGMYFAIGFSSLSNVVNKISACNASLANRKINVNELSVPVPTDLSYVYDGTDKSVQAVQDIENSSWYKHNNDSWYIAGSWVEYQLPNCEIKDVVSGGYAVTATLKDKYPFKLSDGTLTTNSQTFYIKLTPKPIGVPTIQNTPATYNANEQKFSLSGFDPAIMSASTVTNGIEWHSENKEFTATNAGVYTVKFHMDSTNHIWDVSGGTSIDQNKSVTIAKKEIKFSTISSNGSSLEWGLGDTGSLTVNAIANGIDNPDFELNIYYVKDDDTSSHLTTAISDFTLDISKITETGNYTLCVELTSAVANNNYTITNNKYEAPFVIGSGALDKSLIVWQYNGSDGSTGELYQEDGTQTVIRYTQDHETGLPIKYTISASIKDNSYLSLYDYTGSTVAGSFVNGISTFKGSANYNSGCSAVDTYTTLLALKTDKDHAFDDDHKLSDDGLTGWVEITWTISKGVLDKDFLDNLDQYLLYTTSTSSTPQKYDPDNPPEYGSGSVTISFDPAVCAMYGITEAKITSGSSSNDTKEHNAVVSFTMNENYEPAQSKSFSWQLAPQTIAVEWTDDSWTSADGDEFQIMVLDVDDKFKDLIKYEYYTASGLAMGDYVGDDEEGLQKLIDEYGVGIGSALTIYVKAVLKSETDDYRLVDNTASSPIDCAYLYDFGSNNTIVNVTLSETTAEYGSETLSVGILSIKVSTNDRDLDRELYVERIYIVSSDGTDKGDWDDFDFKKADADTYTVRIELNDAGKADYFLKFVNGRTFTITPKAIPVPTLSEVVFKNDFIDLSDGYLGGSYLEYKDIITLGGTYKDVKMVNATPFYVTLTLKDGNYCWDYGTDATPETAQVRSSLTDGAVWTGSASVATCGWSIAPYVLTTSGWNLSGAEGAEYRILSSLTAGLDVGINYYYYKDKGSDPLENGSTLEPGTTYFVKAELYGADAGNFVFENSNTTTSDFATYQIHKSGLAATVDAVKNFMSQTFYGLPVWAWFLIGLAVLILLIIIIAVACKRRKTKEQREEIKARKEEERQRRDEERQAQKERLEEERRMQKEKLDAERELAKAKQEAELEKIRMQAGMAGMASMAMQQPQPQPQQMPQQAQQPMAQPVQQPVMSAPAQMTGDVAIALAKIEAELVQLRANQNAQQSGYMPASGGSGDYHSMYAEERARAAEARLLEERIRTEERARAAEQRAMLAEERYWRGGSMQGGGNAIPAEVVVALLQAVNQGGHTVPVNMPIAPAPTPVAELPQQTAENTSVPCEYPPDAVVTTTTTVDTTKNKPVSRSRKSGREERSEFTDVDGFYDNADY